MKRILYRGPAHCAVSSLFGPSPDKPSFFDHPQHHLQTVAAVAHQHQQQQNRAASSYADSVSVMQAASHANYVSYIHQQCQKLATAPSHPFFPPPHRAMTLPHSPNSAFAPQRYTPSSYSAMMAHGAGDAGMTMQWKGFAGGAGFQPMGNVYRFAGATGGDQMSNNLPS